MQILRGAWADNLSRAPHGDLLPRMPPEFCEVLIEAFYWLERNASGLTGSAREPNRLLEIGGAIGVFGGNEPRTKKRSPPAPTFVRK